MTLWRISVGVLLALAMVGQVQAQGAVKKPVTILVGFPAGQATDLVARLIAEPLRVALDRPVQVENRPAKAAALCWVPSRARLRTAQ